MFRNYSHTVSNEKSVKREFSNPRRLSFSLGPKAKIHTPYNQLKKKVANFSDLKKCFDILIDLLEISRRLVIQQIRATSAAFDPDNSGLFEHFRFGGLKLRGPRGR